ncbi:unnamed protein product [Prorocentrum cordatum]|uniref:FHA domain-containing protein n=1 Tax=Prorocentrum cordatum TaxID=2364126 RepID=A0ABN9UTA4_9DINO|nr:unnamed protein product [Polarella glacialis]
MQEIERAPEETQQAIVDVGAGLLALVLLPLLACSLMAVIIIWRRNPGLCLSITGVYFGLLALVVLFRNAPPEQVVAVGQVPIALIFVILAREQLVHVFDDTQTWKAQGLFLAVLLLLRYLLTLGIPVRQTDQFYAAAVLVLQLASRQWLAAQCAAAQLGLPSAFRREAWAPRWSGLLFAREPAPVNDCTVASNLGPRGPHGAARSVGQDGGRQSGFEVFEVFGHVPTMQDRAVICQACATYLVLPDGHCKTLKQQCGGVALNENTLVTLEPCRHFVGCELAFRAQCLSPRQLLFGLPLHRNAVLVSQEEQIELFARLVPDEAKRTQISRTHLEISLDGPGDTARLTRLSQSALLLNGAPVAFRQPVPLPHGSQPPLRGRDFKKTHAN